MKIAEVYVLGFSDYNFVFKKVIYIYLCYIFILYVSAIKISIFIVSFKN